MKKQLLGTTALVAAGLFALADVSPAQAQQKVAPIQVTVNGYYSSWVSWVENDDNPALASTSPKRSGSFVEVDQHNDGEIHFNGRARLDNGLTVGFRVELESNSSSGDQMDETYGFLEGNWGRLELGAVNNVHYRMAYKAPDVFTRGFLSEGNVSNVMWGISNQSNSTAGTTVPRFADNDSEKINYYTPRWEGFQLGVSYIPSNQQDHPYQTIPNDGPAPGTPPSDENNYNTGWAIAANFVRSFGDFNIAASAGYYTFDAPTNKTLTIKQAPDPDIYSFGLRLGYGGFTVGGAYGKQKDARRSAPSNTYNTKLDGDAWEIGVQYVFGPASVSLTYFDGEADDNVVGTSGKDDEFSGIALAGKYVIGPGVSLEAVLFHAKADNNANSTSGEGVNTENSATGIVAGVVLIF